MTKRIVISKKNGENTPHIRDTNIEVHKILLDMASGLSRYVVAEQYPELTLNDMSNVLEFAAIAVKQQSKAYTIPDEDQATPPLNLDLSTILIVDDTPLNLEYLEMVFKKSEFEVVRANNGYEAIEKVWQDRPFLILTDIQMPRMDGYMLCKRVKTDHRTALISVIFITAYARTSQQVSKGLDMGGDDFVSRPIDQKELLSRVRAVARIKKAELEARYREQETVLQYRGLQEINEIVEHQVQERTGQLAAEKAKLEAVLAGMTDGVLVLDNNHIIQTANQAAARILGFSIEALQGQPVKNRNFDTPIWQQLRHLAKNPGTNTDVISLTQPNSEQTQSLIAYAVPLKADGHNIGVTVVIHDVTALLASERMQARFMTGVTHELKTPLAVLRLSTNNLFRYEDRLSDEQKTKLLANIDKQSTILTKLVEKTLLLAELDDSSDSLHLQTIIFQDIISERLVQLGPLAKEKGLHLDWENLIPAGVTILADREKIVWVLDNLIENAIKYTPKAGSIKMTAKTGSTTKLCVKFTISDTGIGISADEQLRIFERFYRADQSHTIPGTGLGLAIAQEIVHAHGGAIEVTSQPQKGSTFIVRLPGTMSKHDTRPGANAQFND